MPRTLGARDMRPWDLERLVHDMAVGDKTDPELAEEYNCAEQTIRVHRMNRRHEIVAIRHEYSAQYDHIWSTKLENRLRL
jgi:hypothetical protein